MKQPAVLVFGEIIWDVYPDKSCIGGAPLNFAAHFVREGGYLSLKNQALQENLPTH